MRLGRTYLPWSREIKYLGVHLDRRLTWRAHAETMRNRASARLVQVFPILVSPTLKFPQTEFAGITNSEVIAANSCYQFELGIWALHNLTS